VIEQFEQTLAKYGDWPCLSVKRGGKWLTINYKQFHNEILTFAKALIALGV